MQRIPAIQPADATGKAKQLLNGVQAKMGMTPNLMKTLANAPQALEGYLHLAGSLAGGVLEPQFREQVAIAVAQANSCEYCLSAHTLMGGSAGLSTDELKRSREAHSANAKRDAGLQFAQKVVVRRGEVGAQDLDAARQAGFSDAEITEIVAHVALNIFTNYFNIVAQTEVDFPKVSLALSEAA